MSRAVSVTGLTVSCDPNRNRHPAGCPGRAPRSSAAPRRRFSCRSASRLALALVFALSLPGLPGGGAAFGASEVETLRKALEAEKQKADALEADLEKTRNEMQDRIDKAREDAAARIEELFASVTWKSDPEVAVLRKKLDSAGAEIAGLAKAKENTKAYATRLENRLRGMNEMVQELEAAARAEAARVRGRLDAKDKEIEGLQAAVAEAEVARSEIAEIAEQARAKQDVWANRLIGANKSALIAASNAQALREKLDGVQAKLDEVGGERDVLKQELEKAESEIGQRIDKVFAAASGDAPSQVDSLRKELEASNKQIASLEASSQSSSREAEALKQKLAALQDEAKALKAAVAKAETALAGGEALREDLETTKGRAKAVAAERDAAKAEIEEIAGVLLKTQQKAEELQDSLSRSLAARKEMGQQLETALTRAEAQAKALEASQASAREREALRRRLAESEQERARMREELARSQAEVEAARGEISQRIGKLFAVAAEGEPGSDIQQLKEKLAAARQEIARLNAALEEQGDSANN